MSLDPVTITLDWYESSVWRDVAGATPADKLRNLLEVFNAARLLADDCGDMSVADEIEFAAAHPLAAKMSESLIYLTVAYSTAATA